MSTDFNPELYESLAGQPTPESVVVSTTTTPVSVGIPDSSVISTTTSIPEVVVTAPEEVSPIVESSPVPVADIPTIDQLTKGHGRVEEIDGKKWLLGLRGRITVNSVDSLLVVSQTPHAARELRESLDDGWIAVSETETVVPLKDFSRVKRAIRMKRNVSDDVRNRRRERIKAYWERRRAQQANHNPPVG